MKGAANVSPAVPQESLESWLARVNDRVKNWFGKSQSKRRARSRRPSPTKERTHGRRLSTKFSNMPSLNRREGKAAHEKCRKRPGESGDDRRVHSQSIASSAFESSSPGCQYNVSFLIAQYSRV